jgi:ankyrin repeat protein
MKPLHWAVRNDHEDAAKLLLECGTDKSKGYGMPAIIWAVRNSHGGIIRLLLTYGFNIDTTGYGITALHWAAWEGRGEMVRLLMDLGASITRRTTSYEKQGIQMPPNAFTSINGFMPHWPWQIC